jgi:hypothetical protein
MPESGGTTTQSGIMYQNSVAALFLGRLCDPSERPTAETVTHVRVEAPQHVDDTVVTFADGHKTYIQAKENIRDTDEAWDKLWRDFDSQFSSSEFAQGKDRLLFHTGEIRTEHLAVREICKRAAGADNHQEWLASLNQQHIKLLREIQGNLNASHSGEDDAWRLLQHVDVDIWTLEHLERDLSLVWMPTSNKTSRELFRLLRDKAGGGARYRKTFSRDELLYELSEESHVTLSKQPSVPELHEIVRGSGAVLRQHKDKFGNTGIHVEQQVVDEIVTWVLDESQDGQNVGVILDQPGMGKTVVARDTLLRLELKGVDVLAIKADQQLAGVTNREDLDIGLPDSIERVIARLAEAGRTVLLIDQIDALSLSIARDQRALNFVLELIGRVRQLPNVRVLLSCRIFDLNNDPRLKNVEIQKRFQIALLTEEQVKDVVERVGVDIASLTSTTKALLRIPLHLDLFARAFGSRDSAVPQTEAHGVSSLQDLYGLMWLNIISAPDGPPLAQRDEVIYLATDYMYAEQKPSFPNSIFSGKRSLETAANWLAHEGILIPGLEWSFLHQTFFDYCYAKRFVELGHSISVDVLQSDQGLPARPQVLHVLSYLRSTKPQAFLKELNTLLNSSTLRVHLRQLVWQWFGGLPDPTDEEWMIARRILVSPVLRPALLSAMQGNVGWFNRLRAEAIPGMLNESDQALDTEIIPYLSSLLEVSQSDVINLMRPFLGKSDPWNRRLWWLLDRIRNWQATEAMDLFENLFQQVPGRTFSRSGNSTILQKQTRKLDVG